jgi:hypothetical protein
MNLSKFSMTTIFFFTISFSVYAQEFRVSIAPLKPIFNKMNDGNKTWDSNSLGYNLSIDYLYFIKTNFGIGVGLGYQKCETNNLYFPSSSQYLILAESVKILTISMRTKYKLSELYYLELDPLIDFHTNYDPDKNTDDQSGVGFSVGFGGSFKLSDRLTFNLEPRLWLHNIIPFHKDDSQFRLSVVGINLGIMLHKSNT